MSSDRVLVFVLASLLLFGVLPTVAEQEPGQESEAPSELPVIQQTDPSGYWYTIAPESLPVSQLVHGLFAPIGSRLADETVLRGEFLRNYLGIKEGSTEESALLRAVLGAAAAQPDEAERARRRGQTSAIRAAEGDDAAMRVHHEHLKEDYRRLGEVWGRFVADMGGFGARSMVKVRQYVERRRSSISLVSNESFTDPDNSIWQTERVFQEGVKSVLSTTYE